jgi:hypothetical protein
MNHGRYLDAPESLRSLGGMDKKICEYISLKCVASCDSGVGRFRVCARMAGARDLAGGCAKIIEKAMPHAGVLTEIMAYILEQLGHDELAAAVRLLATVLHVLASPTALEMFHGITALVRGAQGTVRRICTVVHRHRR